MTKNNLILIIIVLLLVVIGLGVYAYQRSQEPKGIEMKLDQNGVSIQQK